MDFFTKESRKKGRQSLYANKLSHFINDLLKIIFFWFIYLEHNSLIYITALGIKMSYDWSFVYDE